MKNEKELKSIKRDIADAIGPDEMSKVEAVEWLDEPISDLEMQREALNEEIANGDG